MSQPESAASDPKKPSRLSVATVLAAILVLIPGLCFGIAMPLKLEEMTWLMFSVWLMALVISLLVLLAKGIEYLVGRIRR